MAGELGGVIGRSERPVCFILGAGCSLASGAPTSETVDRALRDATRTRFEGLELRDAIHSLPEYEKQDILRPLFLSVRPSQGYFALAALGRHWLVTVINLNWDLALASACKASGVPHEVRDINRLPKNSWQPFDHGVIDLHVHGIIGEECRYGRLETLKFSKAETTWLQQRGLAYTTVILGASLHGETDMAMTFAEWAESAGGRRPTASQWFFIRAGSDDTATDKLRRVNTHAQPMTYVSDPGIDFDTVATLLADRAIGTILAAR
jgi:hypothetical protein